MDFATLRGTLKAYWPGGQQAAHCVIRLSLREAYGGTQRLVEQDGAGVPVRVPPGVHTGDKIYIPDTSQRGSLMDRYCLVVVNDTAPFKRMGDDLHFELLIDAYSAIRGAEAAVPTLRGETTLTIPPWTAPGSTLRLQGLGMPRLGQPGAYGDLCVHLQVVVRNTATELERRLIGDIAGLSGWRFGRH